MSEEYIGGLIKQYRKMNNLTVKDFIERLGVEVSPGYITQLEVYGKTPSLEMICKIADVIGKKPEDLLEVANINKLKEYRDLVSIP